MNAFTFRTETVPGGISTPNTDTKSALKDTKTKAIIMPLDLKYCHRNGLVTARADNFQVLLNKIMPKLNLAYVNFFHLLFCDMCQRIFMGQKLLRDSPRGLRGDTVLPNQNNCWSIYHTVLYETVKFIRSFYDH